MFLLISGISGLRAVKIDNKWGFMNDKLEVVIEPQYYEVGRFSEGLASFRHQSGSGFINKSGKVVKKPNFMHSGPEGSDPPTSIS